MSEHQHPHTHPHEHPHPHAPQAVEPQNVGAGQGAVMLDIGSGVGALVLYAEPAAAGLEIEISPMGQDERRTHVAVLARPGAGTVAPEQLLHAAVYPSLEAGSWNLWYPDGPVALTVEIGDGEVTEARWPGLA